MNKIITVLTATRAEYGLLKPIIKKMKKLDDVEVRIVVTGMHLSPAYGETYQEIEQDNFKIDRKIEILSADNSPAGVSNSMGLALIRFGKYFAERKPDLLLVLGDRYETLAVCCAAMNARIPIAHLYGGETTEGAIDESIRHAITKMSHLHFTSTEEYRRRVIQLGEAPDRVYSVGAIGIENIMNTELMSKTELEESLEFSLEKPFAIVTFHPVTLEDNHVREQFKELLDAIDRHSDMKFIITKANADAYGNIINDMIDTYASKRDNIKAITSLGMLRYLSALSYCAFVIGNSSSGLLEAPSFHIPTINIGDRQKGRLQSTSVLNCDPVTDKIDQCIIKALSNEYLQSIKNITNPYGAGDTSNKIVKVIHDYLIHDRIELKKKFYNIEFEVK